MTMAPAAPAEPAPSSSGTNRSSRCDARGPYAMSRTAVSRARAARPTAPVTYAHTSAAVGPPSPSSTPPHSARAHRSTRRGSTGRTASALPRARGSCVHVYTHTTA
ncbi:hypothetical protein EV174_006318, partial [Coemansia sp. RSA 2320]